MIESEAGVQPGSGVGRFAGRVAVILGGNSGIGLAAALRFAAEGAVVAISGRDRATLDTAADAIGAGTMAVVADIADVACTQAFLRQVADHHGRIDALLVNAGIGWFADVRAIDEEQWDRVQGVNLRGAFFAARNALPFMAKGSAIVFTSSAGSKLAVPGNVAYAASKAGLRAAARIMAYELAGDGIRVNVVSPGGIDTPIAQREQGLDAATRARIGERFMASVPMGRVGRAEEVAAAVLFLCAGDSSYITGIDLFVDGGITML